MSGAAAMLLASCVVVTVAWSHQPLLPFKLRSLDWHYTWLVAVFAEYLGSSLCFCGIVCASEPRRWLAALWVAGCCLLGTPAQALYLLYRLVMHGTLRLNSSRSEGLT